MFLILLNLWKKFLEQFSRVEAYRETAAITHWDIYSVQDTLNPL